MAGEWIKVRIGLADDPAVVRMAAVLGINEDEVVGKLQRLWGWADQQTTDGCIEFIGPTWVDKFIGKEGFAAAMQSVHWLEFSASGLQLPNFDRHNGKSAKRRALDNERKRAERSEDCPEPVRTPSGQNGDEKRTREEKRREEEKTLSLPMGKESAPADGERPPTSGYRVPPCPYEQIVAQYHHLLPTLDQVVAITDARKRALQARWREVCAQEHFDGAQGLSFFHDYWLKVAASQFLIGNGAPRKETNKPFRAGFDWLIAPSNFIKVVEGRYA